MFWTIWIEHNGRVFNQEQCHKVNVKHIIWDNIIVHAKVAWARVVQFVKISAYQTEALLKGFD